MDRTRDAAAIEEENRTPTCLLYRGQLREQRCRERIPALASQVDDAHGRQRSADPRRQLEPFEARPALRTRRRASVDGNRALERRALRGDRPCVVARVGLLLVRRVVLLVHDHEAEAGDGSEHRRPCTDHDARLADRDPLAFVPALRLGERRVEHRDRVAETRAEAPHRLRRQRDLGHEDDRPPPARERQRAGLEVHLGLPAPRRPVEEDVARPCAERRLDPPDRFGLRVRQALRLGLTAAGSRLGTAPALTTPRPRPRRDERERTRRRRAVVVRYPERELDERGRNAIHDRARSRRERPRPAPRTPTSTTTPRRARLPRRIETTSPRSTSSPTSYVKARPRVLAVTRG